MEAANDVILLLCSLKGVIPLQQGIKHGYGKTSAYFLSDPNSSLLSKIVFHAATGCDVQ